VEAVMNKEYLLASINLIGDVHTLQTAHLRELEIYAARFEALLLDLDEQPSLTKNEIKRDLERLRALIAHTKAAPKVLR
jgi:hypothetical protein